MKTMEDVLNAYSEYTKGEFGRAVPVSDISDIGLAYSTVDETDYAVEGVWENPDPREEHDVQITLHLDRMTISYYIDEQEVIAVQYQSYDDLCEVISCMSFDDWFSEALDFAQNWAHRVLN